MFEVNQTNKTSGDQTHAPGRSHIGSGTPLNEEGATPVYIREEEHKPVITVGPGTPLKDDNENLQVPAAEAKPVTTESIASAPESISASPAANSEEGLSEEEDLFAREFEASLEHEPEWGETIRGTVIRIDNQDVIVDIGSKTEGIVAKEEFVNAQGEAVVHVGMAVEVMHERGLREGFLNLSKRKVDQRRAWAQINTAIANGVTLSGSIVEKCRGGFLVDLGGLRAFLPASHLDLRPVADPEALMRKPLTFSIIKMNQEKGNVVVSRRNVLAAEQQQKKQQILSGVTPGRLVRGVVKNITNFGAFVDIGGVDALLHVNDMSWGKVPHPNRLVKIGDTIEALVLAVDSATGKIALGLKQRSEDPWAGVEKKYPLQALVQGTVSSLANFGAFLRLEEGLEGLIPVSELSWSRKVQDPREVLSVGDQVQVKVIQIQPDQKKITLSLRQVEPEPFGLFAKNQKAGAVVEGVVKRFSLFGAFVELMEGVTGLLHVSDLTWDQSLRKPEEILSLNQKIKVKILEIKSDTKKVALGLKQLGQDPWKAIAEKYPVGTVAEVTVVKHSKFGIFVELEPGIQGLVHSSQVEGLKPEESAPGTRLRAKVVKLNLAEHKIGLSVKEALLDQDKAALKQYLNNSERQGNTLGEMSGISREELLRHFNQAPDA
jgi:small subunit ribosomal protein S1